MAINSVISVIWKYFVLGTNLYNHDYDFNDSSILIMAFFYNFLDAILEIMLLIFAKGYYVAIPEQYINYFRLHEHKIVYLPRIKVCGPITIISSIPRRCGYNLKVVMFKLIGRKGILGIFFAIALGWIPQDPSDDYSTLV